MKRQGNEEFGQDLGGSKVQNTLDGMVCPNKTIFTKSTPSYSLSMLALMLDELAACRTLVRSLLDISLEQHQVAM